ncbi:MAG: NAD(P)H-dependent oxidoreductase [Marinosulfonomonas sp.]|nr:NAD(P)H-dependent oxidoreductase [Marinosulfonomonas sp.]
MTKTDKKPLILGLGGTTREPSTSQRALSVCLREAEALGARTAMIGGADLDIPMYNPGDETRDVSTSRMIDLLRQCDGLILCAPAYHGSVSGLVKNALDYVQDLSEDKRAYLDGRAVGCIACGGGWQAAGQTLSMLRAITHSLRGWPTPMGAMLNSSAPLFAEDGTCIDKSAEFQMKTLTAQVVDFAAMRRLADAR